MNYRKNDKTVSEQRAKRIVAAAITDVDGFYDPNESERMWHAAHEQSGAGYAARDIVEANADGFTMRHANEEQG